MTDLAKLTRSKECFLGRLFYGQPQVGEMSFVRALLAQQVALAAEELGDTTDFS